LQRYVAWLSGEEKDEEKDYEKEPDPQPTFDL
jgi:hypothetical protein